MDHIEITSGIVSSSVTESSDGRRHNFGEIGTRRFFVDIVERGGCCGMWDGSSYCDAIIAAHELAAESGFEVVDLVVTGGAA